MQIQYLIWYKEFLDKVTKNEVPHLNWKLDEIKIQSSRIKGITMKTLRRSNDGYEAMTACFEDFVSKNNRKPQWGELMSFMLDNPSNGINISGRRKGQKIEELSIEGIEKPIDREAFRKRFERYFK